LSAAKPLLETDNRASVGILFQTQNIVKLFYDQLLKRFAMGITILLDRNQQMLFPVRDLTKLFCFRGWVLRDQPSCSKDLDFRLSFWKKGSRHRDLPAMDR
jgi:hypothetical protein